MTKVFRVNRQAPTAERRAGEDRLRTLRTREAGIEQHFVKPVDLRKLMTWLYEVMLRSGAKAAGRPE